ncbi:Uu.00g079160.m01.CDS01 [Anthostomella pinea]|uniref:Uu.00g079160.m01.CDS01 n=1 Tax=Anthostomella pinea TaxID=933095 RepID=A0AAI8VLW3_9PEZI|nr:Uu.00g079160.m01.CDS01 [Anthostomella pinea]
MPLSGGDGDDPTPSPRPAKRPRRSYVACNYIEKLETENAELKKAGPLTGVSMPPLASPAGTEQTANLLDSNASDETGEEDEATADVANPLLEDRVLTENDGMSSRPVYVGGAACTAFANRLGSNARNGELGKSAYVVPMVKHPNLLRSIDAPYTLPSRAYAQVLIQVVIRFVGQDYHLLRKKSFFDKVDDIYQDPEQADQVSLCRVFVVLALGELYLKRTGSTEGGERKVPGTKFFMQAVSLFQEHYEEPDVDYIETILLLSFYSHALNRRNTAYTYAGLALRLSVTLGLHRNISYDPSIHAADIENRRRVWWTVYTFDRLCSSKLGHAAMIRDEDIDVPLPSCEGLLAEEADDFVDPTQLIANIKLSRITGSILTLIYGAETQRTKDFVRNVHTILNNLKQWETELPHELKLDHNQFPSYGSRSVASLRLHFNQCIILTTRPVLLHVFNYHVKFNQTLGSGQPNKPLSAMTVALSEACIYAARASANLLGQLWADGNVATFGYFDAHYIFSSVVVLMMSDALRTNDADNDAITLSWALLQSMVDDGNMPAREFHERLISLRRDVDKVKVTSAGLSSGSMRGYVTSTGTFAANVNREVRPETRPDSASTTPTASGNAPGPAPHGNQSLSNAPLDAPFIQDFLGNFDQSWSTGVLDTPSNEYSEWALALDNTDFL